MKKEKRQKTEDVGQKSGGLSSILCCQCGDADGDSGTNKLLAVSVGVAGAFYFGLFAEGQAPSFSSCKLRHFTLLLAG